MARSLSARGLLHVRLALACLALLAISLINAEGVAQERSMQQVTLTEKQVLGYVAVRQAVYAFTHPQDGKVPNRQDPEVREKLDGIARENGFADYAGFSKVASDILNIMARIDHHTKRFVEAKSEIEQSIIKIKADPSLRAEQKKLALEVLDVSLQKAITIQTPGNIALIEKYYEQIGATLQ